MVHFSTPFCITYVYLSYVAWRRERDSNPRVRKHKLISSQHRYDHFAFAKRILAAGELSLHTKKQKPQPFIGLRLYGGEGGIWTHATRQCPTRFRVTPLRPLEYFSVCFVPLCGTRYIITQPFSKCKPFLKRYFKKAQKCFGFGASVCAFVIDKPCFCVL